MGAVGSTSPPCSMPTYQRIPRTHRQNPVSAGPSLQLLTPQVWAGMSVRCTVWSEWGLEQMTHRTTMAAISPSAISVSGFDLLVGATPSPFEDFGSKTLFVSMTSTPTSPFTFYQASSGQSFQKGKGFSDCSNCKYIFYLNYSSCKEVCSFNEYTMSLESPLCVRVFCNP